MTPLNLLYKWRVKDKSLKWNKIITHCLFILIYQFCLRFDAYWILVFIVITLLQLCAPGRVYTGEGG